MKKTILTLILLCLSGTQSVMGQDVIIRQQKPTEVPAPVVNQGTTPKVTLRERSVPLSVDMPNAREVFPNGEDVPKPDLDRPVVDAWKDPVPYACQAILNKPYYYQQMAFGEIFDLDVTYINTGTQPWDLNIDVMQYTGDLLERKGVYIYDIDKNYKKENDGAHKIVYPGESIRFTIEMQAPLEPYHEDNVYYSAYTLVKNWNLANEKDNTNTPWDAIHAGTWGEPHMVEEFDGTKVYQEMLRPGSVGMFCPVYFYIYVP